MPYPNINHNVAFRAQLSGFLIVKFLGLEYVTLVTPSGHLNVSLSSALLHRSWNVSKSYIPAARAHWSDSVPLSPLSHVSCKVYRPWVMTHHKDKVDEKMPFDYL